MPRGRQRCAKQCTLTSATLHSPQLQSTNDWRPNSSSYPILNLLLSHHASIVITDCNQLHALPQLDYPGFWPGSEDKLEAWILRTWFEKAPVFIQVSMARLLSALRSFWRFTLCSFLGRSCVSSTILGQTANRGVFTCEYIKSWLCKHQIGNPLPLSAIHYTGVYIGGAMAPMAL